MKRTPVPDDLKLGIALGGGGARGWAHIGVLEELAALGIETHIVAGASVGALVGAAYAAGKLETLDDWTRSLTWFDVLGLLDARFRGGVFEGSRVMNAVAGQIGSHRIEDLSVAFGAVACDLVTGREVWLRDGDMMTAVRASCGLPGVFAPTQHDGRWLIDGAVVNPVPVSLCYALGADLVIAVNLNSHMSTRRRSVGERLHEEAKPGGQLSNFEKLSGIVGSLFSRRSAEPGMLDVVNASINIMQERITRSRMAGEPPHVEISPQVQEIEFTDFHRAQEAMDAGRSAVRQSADRLAELRRLLG